MKPLQQLNHRLARGWSLVGVRYLPFAEGASSAQLPLGRLLRLSLFQVSVGMALVLLNGTLNRVMIVELDVAAWLVALMVALPLLFAPIRALVGFKSDWHRSALGWKRVPYIWLGTMLQFGGLAIMPFALILLSPESPAAPAIGQAGAALAFLLVGAGLHITQTAGLALATDLAPASDRPQVVALLYVMLLLGMVGSALLFGALLDDFSNTRLVQVIQGAAVLTMALNIVALWKQEARNPQATRPDRQRPAFRDAWRAFMQGGRTSRLLVALGLGTAAFSMQDILLEPYGGQVMHMAVGSTTTLTALMACGALAAFTLASRWFVHGGEAHRLAACGLLVGVLAFVAVIFAEPLASVLLFRIGAALIGFGAGLFSVATLTAAMALDRGGNGLALGAWGAVQATAAGLAVAVGGGLRDFVSALAEHGHLGPVLNTAAVGYSFVYHLEILLLFATLVAIGPLVRSRASTPFTPKFGLAELPG